MGFFDKIKASVGIGGAKVDLQLAAPTVPRGGVASGVVLLTAGKLAQRCNGLRVQLRVTREVPQEVDGRASVRTVTETLVDEALPGSALDLQPGATHRFDVAIRIPADASTAGARHALFATADIPGAIDPSDTEALEITEAVAPTGPAVASDPLAGMRAWPREECIHLPDSYPLPTVLSPILENDDLYVAVQPLAAPLTVDALRRLVGQPVRAEGKFMGTAVGCLVEVTDDGALSIYVKVPGMDMCLGGRLDDLTTIGRAWALASAV